MNPEELTDIVRRRRDIQLNDGSNRRRKRALSYDLYDTDPMYEPLVDLIERQQFVRPTRAFAPLYWYPSVYDRSIRSALVYPYRTKTSDLYNLYADNNVESNDDIDEPIVLDDDENEAENDYESNRYPILSNSDIDLFDNLQQQQRYNTDDLQLDDDDDNYDDNMNTAAFLQYLESKNNDDDDDDNDDEDDNNQFYQQERPYHGRHRPTAVYF